MVLRSRGKDISKTFMIARRAALAGVIILITLVASVIEIWEFAGPTQNISTIAQTNSAFSVQQPFDFVLCSDLEGGFTICATFTVVVSVLLKSGNSQAVRLLTQSSPSAVASAKFSVPYAIPKFNSELTVETVYVSPPAYQPASLTIVGQAPGITRMLTVRFSIYCGQI